MDHLIGPNVQVVLSLKEGLRFDKVTNPSCIIATLNGLSLESDIFDPDSNPQYATDLVWEANKNTLRKMRSEQKPLKLEFFEINDNGTKDKVGYLILSLRSAQIISKKNDSHVKINSCKLLGLRFDLKNDKPELLYSLIIVEKGIVSTPSDLIAATTTTTNRQTDDDNNFDITDKVIHPYPIYEEGLIQLGPINSCKEIFLLNIYIENIENLNYFNENIKNNNLILWFHIFESEMQSKTIDFNQLKNTKSFHLDEKINLKIRSSFQVLRNYLQNKPYFVVLFKFEDIILGQSEIDLRPLLMFDNFNEFYLNSDNGTVVLNEHCTIKALQETDDNDNKPFFNVQLKLQYVSFNQMENFQSTKQNSYQQSTRDSFQMQKTPEILSPGHKLQVDCHEKFPAMPFHMNLQQTNDQLTSRVTRKSKQSSHNYNLYIKLISMKLRSDLSCKHVDIRFYHPKANSITTPYEKIIVQPGEQLKLPDDICKMTFSTFNNDIQYLLLTFPLKISVYDLSCSENNCLGQANLDTRQLFNAKNLEFNGEVVLIDDCLNKVGSTNFLMSLQDDKVNDKLIGKDGIPTVADEALVYKIVDELETWKERQQEIFKMELKRKEERHLNRLSEEWMKRKDNLELKLTCSVEECKMLTEKLNNATIDLRNRTMKNLEKEVKLIKENEEIKRNFEKKLMDNSSKMKEDFISKLSTLVEQKKHIECQLEEIKKDNVGLQSVIKDQEEELNTLKKGSLTQEQTASFLKEFQALKDKLASSQKSKAFFKEQWGKAVREIHKIKLENQQMMELKIKSSREEMKNHDLAVILRQDSTALSNDKAILNQIQKEIDIIKPKPSYYDDPGLFLSKTSSCSKLQLNLNKPETAASNLEQDSRIQKLIDERDSLLKTGSYTNDDPVIVKINTEIRSLIISN